MKKVALLLSTIILFACGPSEKEKALQAAREKAKQDSLIKAVQLTTQRLFERKLLLQDSISVITAQLDGMKNRAMVIRADLEAAKDKLEMIKQPQFLRTPSEREAQIRSQNIRISMLENEIIELQATAQQAMALRDDLQRSLNALKNQ
ncbi:hypothetical protein KK083_04790 [Fulvivirgaceae bacterium PWU4]|uniref:Uncharacterized protein n=1 Tax=Chryseosolibacter histidini TaxID=2782349 RepID=A0AAP2DIU2_9BACT|nr:hypothetical protein [Chryseosolibacter histidini]MBT1696178.1 hypothetical protein [Chryseosolibacter histidini]